jgi:hypothetical protein
MYKERSPTHHNTDTPKKGGVRAVGCWVRENGAIVEKAKRGVVFHDHIPNYQNYENNSHV